MGSVARSLSPQAQPSAGNYTEPARGDHVVRDFKFKTGEVRPELRLHYTTLGTHSLPAVWRKHLAALLKESAR